MKLHRIRIEQFRKFLAPVEISDLDHGLNVFHGPNEAGKSTIAQALRTLFFERHNTKGDFVRVISPTGSADAAPSIEVDFALGGQECKVAKTFFYKPRARLTMGGNSWEASDADEQLAEWLGFGLSGRGTSRAESHGIPGLLWIEQGASADLDTPVANAAQSIEERLKKVLGDMTSTSGSGLAATLQDELAKLSKGGAKSPGALVDTKRKLGDAQQLRNALQATADEYRSLSDSLARNITERDRLEREKPWQAYEQQKRDAEAKKAALEPQQRALEASRQSLREIKARIASLHEQNQARDKDLRALAAQREALAKAAQTHQQTAGMLKLAEQRRVTAREALRSARAQHQAAEQRQQHESLQAELARIRADIKRIEAILSKADQFGKSIAALREQASATKLSKADLGKLTKLDQALRENRIQRDAIATRVAYRLEKGQSIDAGLLGVLEGAGSQQITTPLTLCIAGIGEIDIAPGGEDIARLSEEADRLRSDMASLFGRLGVRDLADAQARGARYLELEQQIALEEKERDTLLGEHSETEWREQLADTQGQSRDREQRLAVLPAGGEGVPIEDARRIYKDAEADCSAADEQHEKQRQATAEAELVREKAQAHVDSESRRLDSDEARASADHRTREFAEAVARRDTLEAEAGEAAAMLADRKPDLIEADIQRVALALATVEKQRLDVRESINTARVKLETLGADGLDEKLAVAVVAVESLERRLAQYQLRADALSLLSTRLVAHQEAATQRLYAPLRSKLKHYLEILFPGTELGIGVENLRPTALGRGGAELAFESHSHGTREQLGVIARFAYADLLKEADQPTLLILDDALVHSDAERRQQMKRILHDASQRHQILLFTCHPEDWRDAGARVMIDVASHNAP